MKTGRACVRGRACSPEAVGTASARVALGSAGRGQRRRPGRALAVGDVDPLTPPHSLDVGHGDGEAVPEVVEQRRRKAFGEHISELSRTGNMRDTELTNGDLLPDEMNIKLYVLGSPVVHWIPGHIHGGDVVAEGDRRGGDLAEQLSEEVTKPGALGDGVRDGSILRLGARPRDRSLVLRRPQNEGVAEEDAEARCRSTRVRASSLVRI